MKLSKALGGSFQFWLDLQNNWALSQIDETAYKDIKHVVHQVPPGEPSA